MSWYCFSVRVTQADTVAEDLLTLALDPTSLSLISPDVQVYRRRSEHTEAFYFSPAAFLFFKPFIASHHGAPCDDPVATHDQPPLRRMNLKAASATWQVIPPGEITRDSGDFPH